MKIKKPKKPKNLTFQVFRFFKKPKKPRFFKMGLDSPGFIKTHSTFRSLTVTQAMRFFSLRNVAVIAYSPEVALAGRAKVVGGRLKLP